MGKHFIATAMLSDLAYLEPDVIKKKLRQTGFRNFEWIENKKTDTQCFFCTKGKFVYLVFRGSSSDADWATNLDITLVPCKFGLIHRGFRDDARSVYFQIVNGLIRHIIKGRKLVITGHSQGADVGCALAIELLEVNREIECVPHYGGARLVDPVAAHTLDTKYPDLFHRVVNNNDVVTRIAPRSFGYKHFGKLHYFEGDGTYTDDISAWEQFLDRMRHKIDFGGEYKIDILNDHVPGEYVSLVTRHFKSV